MNMSTMRSAANILIMYISIKLLSFNVSQVAIVITVILVITKFSLFGF